MRVKESFRPESFSVHDNNRNPPYGSCLEALGDGGPDSARTRTFPFPEVGSRSGSVRGLETTLTQINLP